MNEAQRESIPIVDARLLQHFDVVRHLTLFSLFPDQHLSKGLTLAADLRLWQMKEARHVRYHAANIFFRDILRIIEDRIKHIRIVPTHVFHPLLEIVCSHTV